MTQSGPVPDDVGLQSMFPLSGNLKSLLTLIKLNSCNFNYYAARCWQFI